MSILLDATTYDAWYSGADRSYYQDQSALRGVAVRGQSGNGRYLVAGCGVGHLVAAFRTQGNPDTWGVDLSAWALSEAQVAYPAIAARFVSGDCRSAASMASVRQSLLGGPTSRRFDVIGTEDLLSAQGPFKRPHEYTAQDWTDARAEAVACIQALRGVLAVSGRMYHLISMTYPTIDKLNPATSPHGPGYWLTGPEWRQVVNAAGGNNDVIVDILDHSVTF